ncbi:MAG: Smr/MutS family protein [Tannerellaceae bacterium]|jgi:DNA mismatch repair protein MutS2|nr:Smr/MutS family protein [Tannerellaceae bacterium]
MTIYPDNFEQKTGFDQVRLTLAANCIMPESCERVSGMAVLSSFEEICLELDRTNEFLSIIRGAGGFPTDNFFDMRGPLEHIRPEGMYLNEKDLFDLRRSLQAIRDVVSFLRKGDEDRAHYPALKNLSSDIRLYPSIITAIDAIIDKYGRIKDNASPALLEICREIARVEGSISRSLASILRAAQAEGVVERDIAPTMRDGRLMIPVASHLKRKIRGIVHDESASGKTAFVEPEAVVEANNQVRELEGKRKREIIRILTNFTDSVRPDAAGLIVSYDFLGKVDFIRAKAIFARDTNAIRPALTDAPRVDWVSAVHPLLYLSLKKQDKKVVPLDITLDTEGRILIVSGPNAGGKSVCLKTVGLLQYMLQCGMLIPASERSRPGIFRSILIDIGDEQSIEDDLSTYSSHLINMKFFLRHSGGDSLLLIDEFGSGTEPRIGGAIAETLLERFNANGAFGLITTHYQNLKDYAGHTPFVVNGAMLYDRHLMQPLFQLSIGNPGSSFAIEIARKTGIPEDVIAGASQKVGADYISLDKYLSDIVRDKRYWEAKRRAIRDKEKKVDEAAIRYEEELERVRKTAKDTIAAARSEAAALIARANAGIENTIREIKESNAGKEETRSARKSLDDLKSSLISSPGIADAATGAPDAAHNAGKSPVDAPDKPLRSPNKRKPKPKGKESAADTPLTTGDAVRLKGQTAIGTILEVRSGKQAVVAFGSIKSPIALTRLERVAKGEIKKEVRKNTFISGRTADEMHEKRLNFKQEIDVRGMRGDEALNAVTYFVDDAILVGLPVVRILHGTGTGVLRLLIRDFLASASGVAAFHDEHVDFGGAGITVVELE